jgi:hypothetical protein
VSQVTLSRNRSLGDRVALSRPCGRGSTLRAFPRVRRPAPSQPIVTRSVAIPVAISGKEILAGQHELTITEKKRAPPIAARRRPAILT